MMEESLPHLKPKLQWCPVTRTLSMDTAALHLNPLAASNTHVLYFIHLFRFLEPVLCENYCASLGM